MLSDALADLATKLHSAIEMRITEMGDELEERRARRESGSRKSDKEDAADRVVPTPSTRDGAPADLQLVEQQAEERTSTKRKRTPSNSPVVARPTPHPGVYVAADPDKKQVTVSELIMDSPPENRPIIARVSSVSPLREWNKDNRSGHVCTLDVIDKNNCPVRAGLFNDVAIQYHSQIRADLKCREEKWNPLIPNSTRRALTSWKEPMHRSQRGGRATFLLSLLPEFISTNFNLFAAVYRSIGFRSYKAKYAHVVLLREGMTGHGIEQCLNDSNNNLRPAPLRQIQQRLRPAPLRQQRLRPALYETTTTATPLRQQRLRPPLYDNNDYGKPLYDNCASP
ncbi:hypothetical protein FOZ63_011904 [Perkinsus olseni]|uniref:Nucleic acid-binding, OB-fold protein n=1 Tax=Perkinsus olseni TaxID=32597 RepID=A0A7J6P7N1_PEROL|nr:hypothetical protein FOZ63_011904 [Perkinsus olseni]